MMPEKKKYSQMIRILYQVTGLHPIRLPVGFMEEDLDNCREKTEWFVLMEPDTTAGEFMYGIAAVLKALVDREIPESYTTLIFSLQSNRPELKASSEALNYAEIWGIQDDVDEDDLVTQAMNQCNKITDKSSMARKIYRHCVSNVADWPHINKEKFIPMPFNLIPQKSSKLGFSYSKVSFMTLTVIYSDYINQLKNDKSYS